MHLYIHVGEGEDSCTRSIVRRQNGLVDCLALQEKIRSRGMKDAHCHKERDNCSHWKKRDTTRRFQLLNQDTRKISLVFLSFQDKKVSRSLRISPTTEEDERKDWIHDRVVLYSWQFSRFRFFFLCLPSLPSIHSKLTSTRKKKSFLLCLQPQVFYFLAEPSYPFLFTDLTKEV